MQDPAREATGKLGSYAYSSSDTPERSMSDVLRDALNNVQDIVRSEVRLAKIEVRDEVTKASSAGKLFGAAAVLGFYGIGFLFLCCVYALALAIPAWAAALIVGGVLAIVAGVCAMSGIARWKQIRMPEKTAFTVKEDVEWIRNQNK